MVSLIIICLGIILVFGGLHLFLIIPDGDECPNFMHITMCMALITCGIALICHLFFVTYVPHGIICIKKTATSTEKLNQGWHFFKHSEKYVRMPTKRVVNKKPIIVSVFCLPENVKINFYIWINWQIDTNNITGLYDVLARQQYYMGFPDVFLQKKVKKELEETMCSLVEHAHTQNNNLRASFYDEYVKMKDTVLDNMKKRFAKNHKIIIDELNIKKISTSELVVSYHSSGRSHWIHEWWRETRTLLDIRDKNSRIEMNSRADK